MIKTRRKVKGLIVAYPHYLEVAYYKQLVQLVARLKTLTIETFSTKGYGVRLVRSFSTQQDSVAEDVEALIDSLKSYTALQVASIVGALRARADKVNIFNLRSVRNSLNNNIGLGVTSGIGSFSSIENELAMWSVQNARLIKSIPEQALDRVADKVYEAVRSGKSISSLAEDIKQSFNIAKNRAKIIARDQIAKLNGNLTRIRHLSLGITEYEWLSSRDERVRPSHDVLEGKVCSWHDASKYKNNSDEPKWCSRGSIRATLNHPAQDIMCRCTAIPIIGGLA